MVLFKHIAGKKSSIFTKVLKCHLYAQNEFEVRQLTSHDWRMDCEGLTIKTFCWRQRLRVVQSSQNNSWHVLQVTFKLHAMTEFSEFYFYKFFLILFHHLEYSQKKNTHIHLLNSVPAIYNINHPNQSWLIVFNHNQD